MPNDNLYPASHIQSRTMKQDPHPNFASSWPGPIRKVLRDAKYHVLLPFLRRAGLLLFEYDLSNVGERLRRLEGRVDELRTVLRLITEDPECMWLYRNRDERMDATVEIFDDGRRAFHLARYRFASEFASGKVVADIACGTGYGTEIISNDGKALRVIGVDVDEQAIAYASARHRPQNVEFLCTPGDKTTISDQAIDLVVSFETLEHVPDDDALLREFHRVLKPGGMLLCSVPNNWPIERTPHHVRVYDRRALESALSRYFDIRKLYNQNSGTDSDFNHDQPMGIQETTAQNQAVAECYIAICRKRGEGLI
ncbi:MAG: methyltransferase domain-containing protein [Syntrophobacteraceae bacterium]